MTVEEHCERLAQALADLIAMAEMEVNPETPTLVQARAVLAAYRGQQP